MPRERKSAFFKSVQEAQQQAVEEPSEVPQNRETVSPSGFSPVPPLDRETASRFHVPTVEPSHGVQEQQENRLVSQPLHRTTVTPQTREAAKPSNRSTVTAELNKTSFYLTQPQLDKLDELAYAYKRQTGKRINRNDIVRFLVDHARFETLLAEW